jgi:hypothetical protein
VGATQCTSLSVAPLVVQSCTAPTCAEVFWSAQEVWGGCLEPCGPMGVALRSVPAQCMAVDATGAPRAVDQEACAHLVKPPDYRPCNRFPCIGDLTAWSVSAWSACGTTSSDGRFVPASCSGPRGQGHAFRNVSCLSTDGSTAPDALCAASQVEPESIAPCTVDLNCTCSSDGGCVGLGEHFICSPAVHLCTCAPGWAGPSCSVPEMRGTTACGNGVVDVTGQCCVGYVDAQSGRCCQETDTTDATGRCCAGASVDACGTCGGIGVVVDLLGVCCSTPLAPSGLCCLGTELDSCGVCGGENRCR